MSRFSILHRKTRLPVLAGDYDGPAAALAEAAARGVTLHGADLRGANLANAMLDGLALHDADLSGANLNGANLSEGVLARCILRNATLYGACLCQTIVTDTDMTGALCGGTDIAGSQWRRVRFSTLSALHMNFHEAEALEACVFFDEATGRGAAFSRPPLTVTGLPQPLVVLDDDVRIGPHIIARGAHG